MHTDFIEAHLKKIVHQKKEVKQMKIYVCKTDGMMDGNIPSTSKRLRTSLEYVRYASLNKNRISQKLKYIITKSNLYSIFTCRII